MGACAAFFPALGRCARRTRPGGRSRTRTPTSTGWRAQRSSRQARWRLCRRLALRTAAAFGDRIAAAASFHGGHPAAETPHQEAAAITAASHEDACERQLRELVALLDRSFRATKE
ncbi:hypothetical protein [Nocardia sp. NPDC003726]